MNLENATLAQREAITTTAKTVLCVAGPGSGKTSTVVLRIQARESIGVGTNEMVCISFTNAAANELLARMPTVNGEPADFGFLGTLHSFCLRMLKRHGAPFGYGERTTIIAPDSAADLMASKATSLSCKTPIERLLKLKAEKGRPERGRRLTLEETVVASYLDELKEAKVVDYDVLLQEFLEMLTSGDPRALSAQQSLEGVFSDLYVDEAQDSAPLDWAIYRALPIPNKFFVGDPDQNLYEWRGARVREIVEEATNPATHLVRLEANFRSYREICHAANLLIEHNVRRVAKRTLAVSTLDGKVAVLGEFENEGEEIAVVARKIKALCGPQGETAGPVPSVAVLARTNAIANGFLRTLPNMGVPVVEQKKYSLPRDWPLARSLIEVLIAPENDSLAYFYSVALSLSRGTTPVAARRAAQNLRIEANSKGMTINQLFYKREAITRPESALAALTGAGVSKEAYMIAVETWRELPPGATMEEFAIALASITEYVKEGTGEGVRVTTVHGAKGKEFDVVFLVGFEDECYPGRAEDPDAIEGERRVAYVGMTRARSQLYFSSVKSRVTAWKAIVPRKPSRFLQEILS